MKRAIRMAVLMVGLVGTFIAAAVQQVPAADGGPLLIPTTGGVLSTTVTVKLFGVAGLPAASVAW